MYGLTPMAALKRAFIWVLGAIGIVQGLCLADAYAQNLSGAPLIFDVRRSLPLEPNEPVFHDFYINAGPEAGFRKGMYVTVVRLVPVHDPVQNKQQATLSINVAKLQVIHVERNITVARLQSEFTDEERPTLEFESVMIGDRIDPASMTMEAPAAKKKKSAKAAPGKTEEAVVQVAVQVTAPQVATTSAAPPAAPAPAAPAAVVAAATASAPAAESAPVAVPGEVKSASLSSSSPAMVRVPVPSAPSK